MAYQPKSYRKFLATSVTAAMVASAVAPVAALAADANFNDIDNVKSWAGDAIEYLVDKGAIEGKGANKFAPYDHLTRAEAATILARALDLNVSDNEKTDFADAKDHWASKYIAAIQRQLPGVINGYNGKFNPNDNVTRQEMAKMIVEAYDDLEAVEGIDVNFPDNNGWGKEYVDILSSLGIVEGKPSGNFEPNANIQRAEAAVLFHRTEVEEVRLIEELAVKNVDILDAKTIQVTFNDGGSETYTVDELKIGEQTEIEIEYKGETFKVVVTYDPNQVAAPGSVKFDNQPAAKSLPKASPLNEVYSFQVTAGEDEITLRSVQLKQYGTARASNEDVKNVHLAVDGKIRATGSLNANGEVRLSRSIKIPANSTVEFTALADISDQNPAMTATVQFGIESIEAFTANAKLNGSFPNVGNSFNIVAGNIGNITVTGTGNPSDAETGESQEELGKLRLQANSTEGAKVKRITLTSNNINADDFENLYLYDNNGTDKINVAGEADRNQVIFDLSDNPIEIGRNQAKTLTLKGDPLETGTAVEFEVENTYDIVAEGQNSGYNNSVTIANASLGSFDITAGDAKLRISPNTPKQGDKIVASTSEYGLVREYDFTSPGEDVTLQKGNLKVYWDNPEKDGNQVALHEVVRSLEVYDAKSGAVLTTIDIPDSGATWQNAVNDTAGEVLPVTNLNWLIERNNKANIQIRAIATDDKVTLDGFDVTLGDIEYKIHSSTGSDTTKTLTGFVPASAQFKEFSTEGGIEISRPSSARIDGYSISGGLSNAPFGGFRIEAKDEDLKITDAKVKVSGNNSGIGALEELIANPVLVYDNEVVAYGDIKSGGIIEFDFNNDFIVETGSDKRKILKMQADVLETGNVQSNVDISVQLDEVKTRGVTSNIVTEHDSLTDSLLSDNTTMDYRKTSVSIDVSPDAIDKTTSSNATILKFKVTNMAPNSASNKAIVIEKLDFTNLFKFPTGADSEHFVLRDDDMEVIKAFEGQAGSLTNLNLLSITNQDHSTDPYGLKGNDDKEFFLYGNLAAAAQPGDDSYYKNVRMRLDISDWTIYEATLSGGVYTAGTGTITPLLINDEGPDITIRD